MWRQCHAAASNDSAMWRISLDRVAANTIHVSPAALARPRRLAKWCREVDFSTVRVAGTHFATRLGRAGCPSSSSQQAEDKTMKLNALMVRYIVDDVDAAIAFYTRHLGFAVSARSGAAFALIERENLQLVLSPPHGPGGGSQPMPDGSRPEPGGWNRIIVRTSRLDEDVQVLRKAGAKFRNDVVAGPGGRQILLQDPSNNLVELFEPAPDPRS
jgi:catechol 2,3-dioxygenase-like lactoylglutathione lyase family enzyme